MNETDSKTQDETEQLAELSRRAELARRSLGIGLTGPTGTISDALGNVRATALELARNNQLLGPNGEICCWNCGGVPALMPSLHCERCLNEHRARREHQLEVERAEHPETKRWRAIHRNMSEDQRLTQELAEELIRRANKLPSATVERQRELQRRYDERFGQRRPDTHRYGGKGFRGGLRPVPDRWAGEFEDR